MVVPAIVVVLVSASVMVTATAVVAAGSSKRAAGIHAAAGTITTVVVAAPDAVVGVVVTGVVRTGAAGMVVGASNHSHQTSKQAERQNVFHKASTGGSRKYLAETVLRPGPGSNQSLENNREVSQIGAERLARDTAVGVKSGCTVAMDCGGRKGRQADCYVFGLAVRSRILNPLSRLRNDCLSGGHFQGALLVAHNQASA